MSLLEARKTYKPFEYPWAYEFWKRQQQIHWMPEEVPLEKTAVIGRKRFLNMNVIF